MKTKNTIYKFLGTTISLLGLILLLASCEVANDLLGGNETVAAIEGDWSCDETSSIFKSTNSVYTVTISADPDNVNGIIIDNFYDVNISVKATLTGKSVIIPNQNAQDGYTVYGSGTISSNDQEINLTYVVNDGSAQDDHVTAAYTKIK